LGNIPDNYINKRDAQKYLRCEICDYCEAAPSNYVDVTGYFAGSDHDHHKTSLHYNDPTAKRRVTIDPRDGATICSQCRREALEANEELWFMEGGDWSSEIAVDKIDNPEDNKTRIAPPPVKDDDYYALRLKEIEIQRKS